MQRRSRAHCARSAGFIEPLERCAYLAATPVTLGGLVWKDDNANGIRQPGELAYSGVGLRLCTSSGTILATATTSSDGHYQFTNVTPGQSVYVELTNNLVPGSLYMLTVKDAGSDPQRNSRFDRDTFRTDIFTTIDGQNQLDLNAGAVPTSGIAASAYEDLNNNGRQDSTEPFAYVFTTYLDTNGNGILDAGEPSSNSGTFARLLPGSYRLCVMPRQGWTTPAPQLIDVRIGLSRFANLPIVPDAVASPIVQSGSFFKVNPSSSSYFVSAPAVAANASGQSVIVWQRLFNTGTTQTIDIRAQLYDASGAAIGSDISLPVASTQTAPLVTMAPDGSFVVAVASAGNIVMRRFSASGTPLTAAATIAAGTAVKMASDANGNFVLLWTASNDGDSSGVFAQRFAVDATPLGAAFRVNSTIAGAQIAGDLSVNASGAFVVTWMSSGQDGNGAGVYAQRFDSAGNAVGGEFRVNTTIDGNQYAPVVSMNSSGAFVVVWSSDTPKNSANAQPYDSNGMPLGGEQILDIVPSVSAVAMDDSGAFTVTWYDSEGNSGTIARRFSATGAPMNLKDVIYYNSRLNGIKMVATGKGDLIAVGSYPDTVAAGTSIDAVRLTAPPAVLVAAPDLSYSSPSSFSIRFSEDVQGSLQKTDLLVENLTAGTTTDPADVAMNYDPSTYVATFTFPHFAGGILPSGSWRFTLAASGVTNSAGRALASDLVYRVLWARMADGGGSLRLRKSSTLSNGNDEIYDLSVSNDTPAYTAQASTLNALIVRGGDADDALQFDCVNGNPAALMSPSYDLGGQQSGDTITIDGTTSNDQFAFDGAGVTNTLRQFSLGVLIGAESVIVQGLGGRDTLSASNFGDSLHYIGGEMDITGSGTLVHDVGADMPLMNVFEFQGRVTATLPQHVGYLSVVSAMSFNGDRNFLRTNTLNVASQGWLDVGTNDVIVDYTGTSPMGGFNGTSYTGITGFIQRGRNGGRWDGTGMVTSAANGQLETLGIAEASQVLGSTGGTFHGEAVDGTAVLVRYTFAGDANLDGTINGDDYFAIDTGYAAHASGYANGDFNYDGRIDADDYFLIDANVSHAQTATGATMAAVPVAGAELPRVAIATSSKSAWDELDGSGGKDLLD